MTTYEKDQGVQLFILHGSVLHKKKAFKPPAIKILSKALFNCGHGNIFNNYGDVINK